MTNNFVQEKTAFTCLPFHEIVGVNKTNSKESKEVKKEESKTDKSTPVAKSLDKGEEVLSILENRTPATPAAPGSGVNANGKFVVQIGAFSSEERVKNWQKKLTEQKVSSYIEIRTNKEGVKLHL